MQDSNTQTISNPNPPVPSASAEQVPTAPISGPNDKFALASLILGVLSLPASLLVYPGLVFSLIAIVFGVKGRDSEMRSKQATIGIILAVLGIISSLIWGVFALFLNIMANPPLS